MNISIIIYYLASMMKVEAVCMLIPCVCALFFREHQGVTYFIVASALFVIGKYLTINKPKDMTYYKAESFVIASLGWIGLSIAGAIPMYLSHDINDFYNAIFESVSGFTTTGATIIQNLDHISKTTIMWRAVTQFVGGMGVLVLMLAILPTNNNNMMLIRAEAPGPTIGKIKPQVKDTAFMLYAIYIGLTIIAMISYKLSGMDIFDAICYGFTTAGTGGFATSNEGVLKFSSTTRNLMTLFMFLFGINFNIYCLIILGKIKDALKSEELKIYIIVIILAVAGISLNSFSLFVSRNETLQTTLFTVVSMITTTGFNIRSYENWGDMSQVIILILMCTGACAASTGCGLKLSRCIIILKQVFKEIGFQIHPQMVRHVKFEGKVVDDSVRKNINAYFIIYINIIIISILLLSHQKGINFDNAIFTAINIFNNIGTTFISKNIDFNFYNNFSKFVLMILMLTGRLEIIPMFALFYRKTWSRKL